MDSISLSSLEAWQSQRERSALQVLCHQFTQNLIPDLIKVFHSKCSIECFNVKACRFGTCLESFNTPVLVCIFRVVQWAVPAVLIVDGLTIGLVTDMALGGKITFQSEKVKNKPMTELTINLAQPFLKNILSHFGHALSFFNPVHLEICHYETIPHLGMVVPPSAPSLFMSFDLHLEAHQGKIYLLIPYSTLEPLRQALLAEDHTQENPLSSQAISSPPAFHFHIPDYLTAVLWEFQTTFGEIMSWNVGQPIFWAPSPQVDIEVRSENHCFFKGRLESLNQERVITIKECFF